MLDLNHPTLKKNFFTELKKVPTGQLHENRSPELATLPRLRARIQVRDPVLEFSHKFMRIHHTNVGNEGLYQIIQRISIYCSILGMLTKFEIISSINYITKYSPQPIKPVKSLGESRQGLQDY